MAAIFVSSCDSSVNDATNADPVNVAAKAIQPQPIPASCRSEDLPKKLEDAKAKWRSHGITDYRYTAERHAMFYLSIWPRSLPFVVTVRNGKASGGPAEMPDDDLQGLTVEGQFKIIEEMISSPPDCLRVTFDPTFGFPTQVDVDPIWGLTDDEQILVFRDFGA